MTPEDPIDRVARQIEGLMKSFGALSQDQARHDERIDGTQADIALLRQDMREIHAQLARQLADIDKHCEQRQAELKAKIEGVEAKIMRQRERQEMTIKEKVTLFAALISGPLAAVLVWLLNGAGS